MRLIPEKSVLLGFYTDGPKMRNLTWKVPVFQIFTFLCFIIAYECCDEEIFAELFRRAHLHLINSWTNFLNVHLIFLLQTIYSEYSLQYTNEIFDHFIKTAKSTVTMLHLHRVKKLEWKGGGSERWYSGLRLAVASGKLRVRARERDIIVRGRWLLISLLILTTVIDQTDSRLCSPRLWNAFKITIESQRLEKS